MKIDFPFMVYKSTKIQDNGSNYIHHVVNNAEELHEKISDGFRSHPDENVDQDEFLDEAAKLVVASRVETDEVDEQKKRGRPKKDVVDGV